MSQNEITQEDRKNALILKLKRRIAGSSAGESRSAEDGRYADALADRSAKRTYEDALRLVLEHLE